jgi:uncharacterized spore protein YtfJ
MKPEDVLATAKDSMTARLVYAEPIEREGVIVVAAAAVSGAGGGGGGTEKDGKEGSGGGFALSAKPAGAYIIKPGRVSWRPAVDVNRLITVLGLVAATALVFRPRGHGTRR